MYKRQVCRLCMVQTSIYFSLLEEETKMLESLTSIKVSANETNISNVICLKCRLNLKLAFNIQQNMIRANKNLLSVMEKRTIKKEMDDEVTIKEEHIRSDEECWKDAVQICSDHCIICGLTTSSINSHVEQHFTEEQKCDVCHKSFYNIQSYKKHLVNHPKTDLYNCKKCAIFFRYKSVYNTHLEKAHKKALIASLIPKPKIYFCDLCDKTSNSKSGHAHHKLNHNKKTCPICKKVLAAGSIRQHIEDHKDSPQICEFCGSTLKNKSCLRMHLRYSHNKETFRCEECGKVFKKKVSLNYHQSTAHGEPKYVCDTCGKRFFSTHRLNIHMKMTHMKLRPYVCEFCKKGFSSKFALTTHKRQHTNETPYRCEVCGEGFRQNVSLKGHKKSKHNIEEPKTCNCKVCGKGFASEWALKTHSRLH